jgi:signal transduction histidine kinase
MRGRKKKPFSIRGPVILFSVIVLLALVLTALWNVVLVHDYRTLRHLTEETAGLHWALIAVGSTLFLVIIVLSSVLGAQLIARTRWSQRQSSFMASVTHELNSPLSAVKLFAQTLRRSDVSREDRLRFVGRILSEVERLNRIIGNILRAAEVDHRGERLPVATKTVNLHEFLRDYVEEARTLRGSEVVLSVAGETETLVDIDPQMFRQILHNLIDNAVRHGGARPVEVTFSVTSSPEYVELLARDNGVGIPADQLESVFRPFSRVELGDGEPRSSGMGIGLHVVRSLVKAHGGEVCAVLAEDGPGATIRIRLPRTARVETPA